MKKKNHFDDGIGAQVLAWPPRAQWKPRRVHVQSLSVQAKLCSLRYFKQKATG
jgi:hypothetical protein